MDIKKQISLILILFLLQMALFSGCTQKKQNSNKLKVIVSIAPLAEFAEKISGDKIKVHVMVPPNVSPHAYEPVPSQMMNVSDAEAYIKVGTPIEFELTWLEKILNLNKNMSVINASEGITLQNQKHNHNHGHSHHSHDLHETGESFDPHVWVSPKNAMVMVENIYQGLVSIDPQHQKYFENNKDVYIEQLKQLDSEIQNALAGKKNRKFMVYHPAWGYFCEHYQLEQVAIETDGKEPTASGLKQLIIKAKNNNIKAIFTSPLFSGRGTEIIADEINGKVIEISNLEKDYIPNLRKLKQFLIEVMD